MAVAPESDFRTDRVALKIDKLIPELLELVDLLRESVRERNLENDRPAIPEEADP